MPGTPEGWRDDALAARWAQVRAVRRVVTAALEVERTAKVIGSSLEAAPVMHVGGDLARLLEGVDLAELAITSDASVSADEAPEGAFRLPDVAGVAVVFAIAPGEKCERCWKTLPDVGTHAHPGLCARCDAAVAGMEAAA